MKNTYPVILIPEEVGFTVFIPDFNANTQGDDITEAIIMARDAIGILGIEMEDKKIDLPTPSKIENLKSDSENNIITLVDVDFSDYRRKHDLKVVKKNCTIPSWLCYEAEKANINFSQVLQTALKQVLNISD